MKDCAGSRYCAVEVKYYDRQHEAIGRPVCDSRASCIPKNCDVDVKKLVKLLMSRRSASLDERSYHVVHTHFAANRNNDDRH